MKVFDRLGGHKIRCMIVIVLHVAEVWSLIYLSAEGALCCWPL